MLRRSGVYIVNEPQLPDDTAEEEEDSKTGGKSNDEKKLNMEEEGNAKNGEEMAGNTDTLPIDTSTPIPETKPKKQKQRVPSVYRSALVKLVCGIYALIIVVLGVVFAVATSLTAVERVHRYYLEVFLVYLYATSLAILLYFLLCLLRGIKVKNNFYENNFRVSIRNDGSVNKSPTASPLPVRASADDKTPLDQQKKESNAEQISLTAISYQSNLELPPPGGVAHVGEGINFYLRLGALAFAFGSVTLDGLHIATYFETITTETCESEIFILVYVMHLLFTFVQTFFIFKNHKLVINKQKPFVRFGMMHLMATNICVLIVTAVMETNEDYRLQSYIVNNVTLEGTKSCYEEVTLARSASPYLFPCTIIYSIIGAGIIYRLYQYIGVRIKQRWPSHTSFTSSAPTGASAIDCDKANKGLFLGLLVAVFTLIAIATFFVFESRLQDMFTAVKVLFTTEIVLMIITGLGIAWGYIRLSKLKFITSQFLSVDSVLLLVALAGSYIYLCFKLIAVSTSLQGNVAGILSLITTIFSICQITEQTVFILDGLCRCAENDNQMMQKPGRAVVTFLLVCNLALWVVSMFEVKKTRVVRLHEEFYGILAWNIITHLCVPLIIFFRFHSAICLSKMWYNAYQKEKTT